MLEHSTTVRAETVDKAIEKALAELNISRSEAEIHVISEGKKGLFGFGKQDAIVEISVESDLSMAELTKQLEEEDKAKADSTPVEPASKPVKKSAPQAEAKRFETKKPAPEKPVAKAKAVTPTPAKPEAKAAATVKVAPVKSPVKEQAVTEPTDDQLTSRQESRQIVARYLEDVIRAYGAEADITVEEKGYQVIFNIETNKSGLVIGKHGKIINALQTLAQIMVLRYDRRRTSVLLNVGDYRDRRSNVLDQIAQRTAEQVLRTKLQVVLDPLPAYERKQIHAYLSKIDHVKTHSEGKDPNRYLVVEYVN